MSPAPSSQSPATGSLFKRLKSSFNAPAGDSRATTPEPSDSIYSVASPPPAMPDTSPIFPVDLSAVSAPTPVPHVSPPQQAEDHFRRAGRLGSQTAAHIDLVPSAWEATSSTAELLAGIVAKLCQFARVSSMIGEVHPYLKAATSIVTAIVKPVVNQDARDDNFEDLLKEMQFTYDHILRDSCTVARLKEIPATRRERLLKEICKESEQCAHFIQNEYIGTFWMRAVRNVFNGGKIDKKIQQYKSSFSGLRARWQEEVLHWQEADRTLERLSPMRHAGPSSLRACLHGTRTVLLEEIRRWIDDPDSPRVLFVLGVAGSGKTSIANTVAEIGRERAELASFFAFNRNDSARVPDRLLGTIAYQLAHWDETYRDCLAGILKADGFLADSPDILRQWKRLIVEAATSMSRSGPVLLVIDAFDECPELPDNPRQRLLECLTLHASDLPAGFRVLVTSRPLEQVVEATTAPSSVRRIDLSDFPADWDIRQYVRSQLPPRAKGGLSDSDCDLVARTADGLFQWAATACRFLASKLAGTTMSAKFAASVQWLIHGDPGLAQRPNGPPSLDALYLAVMEDTFDGENTTVLNNFRSVVAVMLCAETTSSIDILQSILHLPSQHPPVPPQTSRRCLSFALPMPSLPR